MGGDKQELQSLRQGKQKRESPSAAKPQAHMGSHGHRWAPGAGGGRPEWGFEGSQRAPQEPAPLLTPHTRAVFFTVARMVRKAYGSRVAPKRKLE